jgi:hypothetical protein
MRSLRGWRREYTERHPGAFVAPNVDEALGEIVAPSDERTVTGFLSAEVGPWELSHWLRCAPGDSPVARRVGILRHHLSREHATDPRVVHRVRVCLHVGVLVAAVGVCVHLLALENTLFSPLVPTVLDTLWGAD